MKTDFKILKELVNEIGIFGNEFYFVKKLSKILESLGLNYKIDSRNTIFIGNFETPKIILGCHYDEVGFEIVGINEDGSLNFFPVGNLLLNHLIYQKVEIVNEDGKKILGYVNNSNIFMKNKSLSIEDLSIYIGACNREEVYQKFKIKEGCFGSFKRDYEETEDFIIASAIDNRVSIFIIIQTYLSLPQNVKEKIGVFFYSSEEHGCYSEDYLANKFKADFIFILDYCPANIKSLKSEKYIDNYPILGKGPAVFYAGKNYLLSEKIKNLLKSFDFQKSLFFNLVSAESGRFVRFHPYVDLTILLPTLGYHSSNYFLLKKDIEATIKFLSQLIDKSINYDLS